MKKKYTAMFSFFAAEENTYYDCGVQFDAADRYAAREKAWELFEKNHSSYICSEGAIQNVKLCGLRWEGSPLDIQDYFDAQSDSCQCEINRIRNVDLANCRINPAEHKRRYEEFQRNLYSESACRHLLDNMAKELYAQHGMIPPSIHTELHYAQEMANSLYHSQQYDLADKLSQALCDAEHWQSNATCTISELFREHHLYYDQRYHDMNEHFARDGCYPCSTTQQFEVQWQAETQEMGGVS